MHVYFHNLDFVLIIIWNVNGVLSEVVLESDFVLLKGFFVLKLLGYMYPNIEYNGLYTFAYYEFYYLIINVP